MQELIAVALITILAVISPGGDFAMVTRNSYLHGRRAGVLTSLGIASAVWIHVGYTLLGVSILLLKFPTLFHFIKILGAIYLVYIGFKTFNHHSVTVDLNVSSKTLSDIEAFKNGFVTNALNPKTTLFVLSTFTQIVKPTTSIYIQLGYGAFMSIAHLIWFVFVAEVLSSPLIRNRLLKKQKYVNRFIGAILILLGGMLIFSSIPF
ncbi:LysE family translocator [Neisseria sp.]|uniref:LysE family translocator n=1 Tax=Neisseria sp. TaxID=192066 RepID=UPI0026DC0EC6|nr:LysE family transporter [Neisseria sp.]MDO4226222.1 LysE family transporter [Neisseria sp.]